MAALPVTPEESTLGLAVRAKLDQAFKEGTTNGGPGNTPMPGPVALTTIPSVVLDLYEIAYLAALQVLEASPLPTGVPLPIFTVAGVPSAVGKTGFLIYVSNEGGGAVPAFSDGTNWRRVTDRLIIS